MVATSDWSSQAKCLGSDPQMFFSDAPADRRRALRMCDGCPVKTACFTDALDNDEPGVRGGTTELQRRQARRQQTAGPTSGPTADLTVKPDGTVRAVDGRVVIAPVDEATTAWLVILDRHIVDRCATLDQARAAAHAHVAQCDTAAEPQPDGSYTDPAGRVVAVPVGGSWIVLADGRVVDRCAEASDVPIVIYSRLQTLAAGSHDVPPRRSSDTADVTVVPASGIHRPTAQLAAVA